MSKVVIRREQALDQRIVEEVTREAFWNHFQPGADEHFITHTLRSHTDYIPELNFVLELDNQIIGSIVYSRSRIEDSDAHTHKNNNNIITFGPVCILPKFQRQKYGSMLIRHSIDAARHLGYDAIVIYGDPRVYHRYGFRCAEKWNIASSKGLYAVSLLALPLKSDVLNLYGKFDAHTKHTCKSL